MPDSHKDLLALLRAHDDGPAEHLWPGALARGAYHTADGGLAVFSAHLLRDELCAVTPEAQRLKLAMLKTYRSQRPYTILLRNSFISSNELFFDLDVIPSVARNLGDRGAPLMTFSAASAQLPR